MVRIHHRPPSASIIHEEFPRFLEISAGAIPGVFSNRTSCPLLMFDVNPCCIAALSSVWNSQTSAENELRLMQSVALSRCLRNGVPTMIYGGTVGRGRMCCGSRIHGGFELSRDSPISLGRDGEIDWRAPERLRNMIDQYRQGWASCRR